MDEQPLQDMELKEKESQKGKVCARNVRGPLDTNWELLSFGGGRFGDLLWKPPMGFGANPGKVFDYLTLIRL